MNVVKKIESLFYVWGWILLNYFKVVVMFVDFFCFLVECKKVGGWLLWWDFKIMSFLFMKDNEMIMFSLLKLCYSKGFDRNIEMEIFLSFNLEFIFFCCEDCCES